MTDYTIDHKRVPLSVAKGLDHGWEAEKGHLCDSRRAVLLSVSRQKCWPAHMKRNERSKRVFGGGGCGIVWRTPALQAVECFGKICQRQPTFAAQILECERIPD